MHRRSGKLFIIMLIVLTKIRIGGNKQDSNFLIKTFEAALLNKVKIYIEGL